MRDASYGLGVNVEYSGQNRRDCILRLGSNKTCKQNAAKGCRSVQSFNRLGCSFLENTCYYGLQGRILDAYVDNRMAFEDGAQDIRDPCPLDAQIGYWAVPFDHFAEFFQVNGRRFPF